MVVARITACDVSKAANGTMLRIILGMKAIRMTYAQRFGPLWAKDRLLVG
jgi:hypothetical protein